MALPLPPKPNSRLSSLLLPLLALLCLFLLYHSTRHSPFLSRNTPPLSQTTPAALFLSLSSAAAGGGAAAANATIAGDLRALTLRPHLAGTPAAAAPAAFVLSRLRAAGLRTLTREYSPLLSYPSAAAAAELSLLSPNGSLLAALSAAEPADPAARLVRPYHAYAPSGAAAAPAVYVNRGREEDFRALERIGVRVEGCVAIARRGGGNRGGVVARAAERGAAAVLIAGDPGGGVERGAVLLGGVGDPLTPGWGAAAAAERLGPEADEVRRRFPRIPSMPVAAATAAEILRTLGGPPPPPEWATEGLGFDIAGVGPGPNLVNFTYQEDRKLAIIQNVFGLIRGREEPDRYIIIGNHRDAWTYGAVDPNSGTAVLLDIARRFGILLRSGWRPRRTIILCSWDAEEFGMIGSTEWVEENLGNLHSKAVVYLNVDCAVQGPGFFAGATPQLDKLLIDVTKKVKDPDLGDGTVYHTWERTDGGINIERLARADSDFSAFLHYAGIPSADFYYGKEFPGYHTALDSYSWMENQGDPMFHRHVAVAEILGLLTLRLADDPVLPFDYVSYAAQLQEHANALSTLLDDGPSLEPIYSAIQEFSHAANEALKEGEKLQLQEKGENFSILWRRAFNDRLMLVERSFLEAEGLKGRWWFKHLLYSPPEDYESQLSFFPGIADAISRAANQSDMERQRIIQHEIWRVARAIQRAASALKGELF
ncbi:probable glutamate carboxypeptidase 2 isoform X1 [Ananas comosus]|uniref:glutamate carboxypeptidase II n=1 Tax=Ananas comosus TaxID=4615 RepID=A0A6P5EVC4_ANACO|nr:probable glutamate carboxypeptidase 2 isoform X1 [Ananas comosus]XP_020087508.1 probable glutamate carboxypeptidase 2 isoform X1 [Ananas comosus]XP_020087509.1 probable glutamate carboxypeptidase 2 isoform X1 [Ananas comosus]